MAWFPIILQPYLGYVGFMFEITKYCDIDFKVISLIDGIWNIDINIPFTIRVEG